MNQWGRIAQMDCALASHPGVLSLVLRVPKIFSHVVAEIYLLTALHGTVDRGLMMSIKTI